MKDYLNNANYRFYLNLGKYSFSPVIQASTAIALDYAEELKNSKNEESLLINFPSSENTALWISIQFLINEFFKNYIYQSENRIKELELKAGDKIDIFSTTAIFHRIDNTYNKLVIKFSDGVIAHTPIQNVQFINSTKKKIVNKYVNYRQKRKLFLNDRKALTQILGLDLNPNFGALSAKVVLIAGRGKAGLLRTQLKNTMIYNEPLAETVLLDKNLLIFPDFNCFSTSESLNSDKNTVFFIKAVKQCLSSLNCDDTKINSSLNECLTLIDNSLKTTKFVEIFQTLYTDLLKSSTYETLGNKLQYLMKYHPGIEADLINNVSAIFVNDIQLAKENPSMIQHLTNNKIPVFLISDKGIGEFGHLDIYNNKVFENIYRFNWDKKKLLDLDLSLDDGSKFIDFKNNNSFYRFSDQQINITELDTNEFDQIFNAIESSTFLSSLGGLELLQKAYYQTLRPLLYSIKNSIEKPNVELIKFLDSFIYVFEHANVGLDNEIKTSINESLQNLKSYILSGNQPKRYDGVQKYLFYQDICIEDTNFIIPTKSEYNEMIHHNDINQTEKFIRFIGYPYREYSFKFIDQSIFKKIIPRVDFILNKCESQVTINFLKRKISSCYFVEKFPSSIKKLDGYRIKDESEFKNIVEDLLKIKGDQPEIVSGIDSSERIHEFEKMLNEIRYSNHKASGDIREANSQYLLNSNVLHFENGSYVFIPHNWRILILKESITGSIESRSCKIEDVSVGDIAVIVNVSRKSITKYLENSDTMLSHLLKLESWREILKHERGKIEDVSDLMARLENINELLEKKGNPENYNVLRWLHDEMMLAPTYENLKMILGLRYPINELSERANSILNAKTIILKAKNKLDRAVKDKLADMISSSHDALEDNFTIKVQGIEVRGKKNEIVGIEKRDDLKIEYHSTMKFLK